VATRHGHSRGAFVRRQPARLGLGTELTDVTASGKMVRLPPAEAEGGNVQPFASVA